MQIYMNNFSNDFNLLRSKIKFQFKIVFFLFLLSLAFPWLAQAKPNESQPIQVLAAENMYGNIAQQIGGNFVKVRVILNNPDQDPHLFELTPGVGKILEQSKVIIANGAGYDPWLSKLLQQHGIADTTVVNIQQLLNVKDGDNPHLWYNVSGMGLLANHLTNLYSKILPSHREIFLKHLKQFSSAIINIQQRIQAIKVKTQGIAVAATEPVFGIMAQSLGFNMQEMAFQWIVMNDGEPSPREVAQFEQDLRQHKIKLFFYNSQVSTPETKRLARIAQESGIPIIGVTETMPEGLSYQQWMNQTLDKVEVALPKISK